MKPKLKWENLLVDKCPKCGSKIFADDPGVNCTAVGMKPPWGCDFFITQERLQELKKKISVQRAALEFDHDNSEALNNL